MDNTVYYIWLQTVCGMCSSIYLQLFERFSSAKDIYECEDFSFIKGKYACLERLNKKDLSVAFEIYKKCKNNDVRILTYHDKNFPVSLRLINAPPAVLYCKGKFCNLNDEVCIAIVGTRKMTEFGGAVAEDFAYSFTKCGAVVVSGLAKGIDTAAHNGALRANGYTVAVLGTPIDHIYPTENEKLFYFLYENGLVLSEMYPGCPTTRADFPNRNRIISGLCKATVVAEAGENSGALITARHAVVQGKRVYAIPGAIGSDNAGTNALIKTGIEAATTPLDVLSELALMYPTKIKTENCSSYGSKVAAYGMRVSQKQEVKKETAPEVKPTIKSEKPVTPLPIISTGSIDNLILNLLSNNKPMTADELAVCLNVQISEIMISLTMLEIGGKINSLVGNRYIKS
ncbi:MAG: DNA protecting protein DprA [Clostridiales bacterium GWF2_36_10]|nr:MAG: DNA protecting protein DprA [Clostridiales bacterium GWF2_36_10]HAN21138.1 DNA-protecting protein DprA [Clostridiales bacterium]